jgi:hypothetical protein
MVEILQQLPSTLQGLRKTYQIIKVCIQGFNDNKMTELVKFIRTSYNFLLYTNQNEKRATFMKMLLLLQYRSLFSKNSNNLL